VAENICLIKLKFRLHYHAQMHFENDFLLQTPESKKIGKMFGEAILIFFLFFLSHLGFILFQNKNALMVPQQLGLGLKRKERFHGLTVTNALYLGLKRK
jgi:hypothetical protein